MKDTRNEHQKMQLNRTRIRLAPTLTLCAIAFAGGCAAPNPDRLSPPRVTMAPYDSTGGEVLWAVAPLHNETGTTSFAAHDVTDQVVAACAEVRGVRVLPLNRTLEAMRTLKMDTISSPADAKKVAMRMGADAIIIGTVTAWDPYTPTMGLSLALFPRPGSAIDERQTNVDPRVLAMQTSERSSSSKSSNFGVMPAATASEHLDGKNHQVLMDIKNYAAGRSDPKGALGWKRYVASMPLFSEFATHYAVGRLVESEWLRVGRIQVLGTDKVGGSELR